MQEDQTPTQADLNKLAVMILHENLHIYYRQVMKHPDPPPQAWKMVEDLAINHNLPKAE